jgi:hypothetical protein
LTAALEIVSAGTLRTRRAYGKTANRTDRRLGLLG